MVEEILESGAQVALIIVLLFSVIFLGSALWRVWQ